MRWATRVLGCLVLAGVGCLNQVAPLIGDSGADSGVGCGLGDGDAGVCTDDSQCPDSYYCDFAVTECPSDGGPTVSTINPGSCLPACPSTGIPGAGAACHVGEDCAPFETCYGNGGTCTAEQPCETGVCLSGEGPPPPDCSLSGGGLPQPQCRAIRVPHTPWDVCVCDGNTCSVPDAGPSDAGTADAGQDGGLMVCPSDAGGAALDAATTCVPGLASDLGMRANYPTNTGYFTAVSGDLNGDGLLDLAACWFDEAGIDVFLGQSDGSLASPIHYPVGAGEALAIADLDGDGLSDLVAPDLASNSLQLYISVRDGGIPSPVAIAIPISGTGVTGLAAADLNGDGLLDLVWTSQQSAGFLLNRGGGTFGSSQPLGAQGGAYGGILVVDLNGDGRPDIAINGSALYLILSQADGGYETTSVPLLSGWLGGGLGVVQRGTSPLSIAFVEWTLAGMPGEVIQMFTNQCAGNMVDGGEVDTGEYSVALVVGDFNGDCLPDLAAAGWDSNGTLSSSMTINYGMADGGFGPPMSLDPGVSFPQALVLLGPVESPRALGVVDFSGGGVTVLGDASKH